jgi:thiol-disulfide isomerase/thioredoxin
MRTATIPTLLSILLLVSAVGLGACDDGEESRSRSEALASESTPAGDTTREQASQPAAGRETAGSSQTSAPSGDLPVVLAKGQEVDVTQHLDEGRITIIDFYSDYCGPCKRLEPYMLQLHREREDITVVKVDINRPGVRGIDWQSPVARQYRLQSIPHFQVYDAQGRLLAEGPAAIPLLQGYMQGKS